MSPAERAQLRATLGALLTAERLAGGWSVRRLARAAGLDRRTLQRLAAGTMRPREVTLHALASVLAVNDPGPLAARLLTAAGPSLRPNTDGAVRRRRHRAGLALVAGHRPLPSDLAERVRLHRTASAARAEAYGLLHRPGALDDPAVLDAIGQLLDESRQLHEQAGPAVVFRIGRHQIHAGWAG
ncbi:Helix-turn-helix [Amycolatopsis tolypomycina]|uniref:Helix-turn-helix n=1 Tax=Amycolatopsis tolypomycina TaxID=208445 RepID=A0A1H4WPE4_9PSEU|nr:helix-turn-helix transcriptional regulator [Amycolatopsis tolypomycina]SEC95202.1 Helix-turn-helix [Amycolatopsis tolypomycina]